jgi:predicted ArsR family transcriptional regulator
MFHVPTQERSISSKEKLFSHRPFERLFRTSAARLLDFFLIFREFDYSKADVARKTKITPKTMSNCLDMLVEEGLIEVAGTMGRSNMYRLTDSKRAQALL